MSALTYVCCLSLCNMCYSIIDDAQQIVHCNCCTKVAVPLLQSICRSAIVAVQCGLACANVLQSCFDHIVIFRFRSWQISIWTKILSLWALNLFLSFPPSFCHRFHRYILYLTSHVPQPTCYWKHECDIHGSWGTWLIFDQTVPFKHLEKTPEAYP